MTTVVLVFDFSEVLIAVDEDLFVDKCANDFVNFGSVVVVVDLPLLDTPK